MQGRRPNQEDAIVVLPPGLFRAEHQDAFFGIFDGHAGTRTAQFCADHLADYFRAQVRVSQCVCCVGQSQCIPPHTQLEAAILAGIPPSSPQPTQSAFVASMPLPSASAESSEADADDKTSSTRRRRLSDLGDGAGLTGASGTRHPPRPHEPAPLPPSASSSSASGTSTPAAAGTPMWAGASPVLAPKHALASSANDSDKMRRLSLSSDVPRNDARVTTPTLGVRRVIVGASRDVARTTSATPAPSSSARAGESMTRELSSGSVPVSVSVRGGGTSVRVGLSDSALIPRDDADVADDDDGRYDDGNDDDDDDDDDDDSDLLAPDTDEPPPPPAMRAPSEGPMPLSRAPSAAGVSVSVYGR
jgi:hypothetical protein